MLYHKNRNYETGILAFKCAIRGCTAEESCPARGECGPNDIAAEVVGLPLDGSTVYYYDVYASQLAALSTPRDNKCDEALEIARILETSEYISDPNIAADMVVVRNICNSLEESINATATPQPTGTPESTPTP